MGSAHRRPCPSSRSPEGLSPEQRRLVDLADRAVVAAHEAGEAMTRGDVPRRAYNAAQEDATRALAAAAGAGVPAALLEERIAAVHDADRAPVLPGGRS